MKKYLIFLIAGCAVVAMAVSSFAQNKKLAQTGMKFLSVTTDARASALGEAVSSIDGNSSAMFFNPAGMARQTSFADVSLGTVSWIADIKYVYGSAALSPANGLYGVIGFSFLSVNYGDFQGTIRDEGDQGFLDTEKYSPSAVAFGVGYAKALSDKFAVGGNVKYVTQDLGSSIVGFTTDGAYDSRSYSSSVVAFDFGMLYRTGYKSLNFGMNVRNFSKEIKYVEESFQLPLTFKIGVSMNAFDLYGAENSDQSLLVSVDAVHPRDYPEQLNFGGEYVFMKTFALRAGYSFPNDEHGFSAGGGFQKSQGDYMLAIDYAYTPFGIFDAVHRFSLHFGF